MSLRTWVAWLGLSAICLAGCGDDAPSRGNELDKPYGAAADGKVGNSDPDLSVADLNDAEWKAACVDIGTAGDSRELVHGPCILAGLTVSVFNFGFDCMDTYELCLEQPDDIACDEKPADCTATLRELDACSVSQLVWLAEQTRDLDCSSPFSAISQLDRDHRTPECDAIEATCPAFRTAASPQEPDWF